MGHKVHPLIFRSKLYPTYDILLNPYQHNVYNLSTTIIIESYIKANLKVNILDTKFKHLSNNKIICSILLVSKNNYAIHNPHILDVLNKVKTMINTHAVCLHIYVLKNPLLSPAFLLNYIISQYKVNKISLRRLIKQIVALILKQHNLHGLKFIVSGRINGVQIARTETFNFNHISLHYLKCRVRYKNVNIQTKYGLLGFKLWLFLN